MRIKGPLVKRWKTDQPKYVCSLAQHCLSPAGARTQGALHFLLSSNVTSTGFVTPGRCRLGSLVKHWKVTLEVPPP